MKRKSRNIKKDHIHRIGKFFHMLLLGEPWIKRPFLKNPWMGENEKLQWWRELTFFCRSAMRRSTDFCGYAPGGARLAVLEVCHGR